MAVLVYNRAYGQGPGGPRPLEPRYSVEVWRPSWRRVVPAGLPLWPYGLWWLFHQLRVFANRDYAIVLVRDAGRIAHRCP